MFWQQLKTIINSHQASVYLVGGFWRDLFLGKASKDLDLMVMGDVKDLAEKLSVSLEATLITLDQDHEIYRLVIKGEDAPFNEIDLAKMQGNTFEEDLAKRDLTFNAMAYLLEGESIDQLKLLIEKDNQELEQDYSELLNSLEILDPYEGKKDLAQRVIRLIKDDTLRKDPLRLLRCGRFLALLDGQIEKNTLKAIHRDKDEINRVSRERVREELFALLRFETSFKYLQIMDEDWGLIPEIFPTVRDMKQTEQNFHHVVDVWTHCLYVYKALEEIYLDMDFLGERLKQPLEEYLSEALAGKGRTKREILKLVALFHDIGKVKTKQTRDDGRITFYGHDLQGSEEVKEIASSLVLSNKEISWISLIVKGHMRPLQLLSLPSVSRRAKFRLFKEYGTDVLGIFLLSLADLKAKQYFKSNEKEKHRFQTLIKELMEEFIFAGESFSPPKILSGKEILSSYPEMPRKKLGPILGALEEAQVLGLVENRTTALHFVESMMKEK